MEKARELFRRVFNYMLQPEMRILPGQLAFFLIVTVIPLIALIATIAAALSISTESIRVAIDTSVPKDIASLLNGIVENGGINFNIFVFYISAILLASNGTYSMINISNEIYKVKPKNIISRRLKALAMIAILIGVFLFLIIVPIFGNTILEIILEVTNNTNIVLIISNILTILKYPIIIIILFINIKLMYIIAPDEEIPSKTTNKGAIFTTILWVISTEVFAYYIGKFSSYDLFYGSISNLLILFMWIYILSYIFIFGMIINASTYKKV